MIFEHAINVFDFYPECIIHPVSCSGVCHDTLSKQIKKSYPDYFREYTRFCIRKKLLVGQSYFYHIDALFGTKYIVTFTTKLNWQEKIYPHIFKQALNNFINKSLELKINTVAIPKLKEVPQEWLKEQLEKISKISDFTIKKIIFF